MPDRLMPNRSTVYRFPSRTKSELRTWYENETIYNPVILYLTEERQTMTKGKSPCEGPGCPALLAIGMIGSELKLGVLHSLLSGPKRFNELRLATGICQSSLAKTLKELEDSGVAERKVIFDRPVAVEYRLSPMGEDLFEAIRGLEHWATKWVMEPHSRNVTA